MGMHNKTLWYLMRGDAIKVIFLDVIFAVFCYIVAAKLGAGNPVYLEMLISTLFFATSSEEQSFMQYGQYITFGFCRKRFYREQVAICGVRAAILSLVCSAVQYLCHDSYVLYFMEDTEDVPALYHRVFPGEIFLTDMLFFFLLCLILLLASTQVVQFAWFASAYRSPQLKYRIQMAMEQTKWIRNGWSVFVKLGIWIVVVAVEMGFVYYHYVQMTMGFPVRLGCMAGMAAVSICLYLVGKKRFVPEYI
ncbi:MAG: hypothetical protein IJ801_10235 [Lachnospiraceae bacterium]|nr:hypothetical protein [Lachnospiraceae bacterium]